MGGPRCALITFAAPAPVVVTAVGPNKGGAGTPVTIDGSGFVVDGTTVHFGETAAEHVGVASPTSINTRAPRRCSTTREPWTSR